MKVGFLGFGEAGEAMARSLLEMPNISISAYDRLYLDSASQKASASDIEVTFCADPKSFADTSEVIISVVTADEAEVAAKMILPYLTSKHLFFDGNSVSPGTKRTISEAFEATGNRYVDLAIMAPIHPRGHKTPMLAAGPAAEDAQAYLDAAAFSYEWRGNKIGEASTVKMLRSILIKGVESLVCECVTAAEDLGLDSEILSSAGKTLRIDDMPALADYVMERAAVHGRRRAAEMREVAKTLEEMNLSNFLATAIAKHQDYVADMNLAEAFDGNVPRDRAKLAPAMRAAQKS